MTEESLRKANELKIKLDKAKEFLDRSIQAVEAYKKSKKNSAKTYVSFFHEGRTHSAPDYNSPSVNIQLLLGDKEMLHLLYTQINRRRFEVIKIETELQLLS